MEKFKIHSVETVSEVSQKSSVKIVTCKTKKGDQKVNQIFKKNIAGQVLTHNSKNLHRLNKTRTRIDYGWIVKKI